MKKTWMFLLATSLFVTMSAPAMAEPFAAAVRTEVVESAVATNDTETAEAETDPVTENATSLESVAEDENTEFPEDEALWETGNDTADEAADAADGQASSDGQSASEDQKSSDNQGTADDQSATDGQDTADDQSATDGQDTADDQGTADDRSTTDASERQDAQEKSEQETQKKLKDCTVSLSKTAYTYSGEKICPSVHVNDGETILKKGTDYSVSYQENLHVGTAKVIVTGMAGYTGTVTKTFRIKAKSIRKLTATLAYEACIYNGKARKPAVTLRNKETVLKRNRDYQVTYCSNKKAGRATVILRGIGDYSGVLKKPLRSSEKTSQNARERCLINGRFITARRKNRSPRSPSEAGL